MKRLLTFIYGLLFLSAGVMSFWCFLDNQGWNRWITLISSIFMMGVGFNKLDKATEDEPTIKN